MRIDHKLTLETLESVTNKKFAKVILKDWERSLSFPAGNPKIYMSHVELTEDDGSSTHMIKVTLIHFDLVTLYQWNSAAHDDTYYNFAIIHGDDLKWLVENAYKE